MAIQTDAKVAAENEKARTAWDDNTMGFGKHKYHLINPETINLDDYARKLEGEEARFGDVRQYNSASNEKHPENDVDLDWLGRIGTVFETEAEGYEGSWFVSNMPVVHAPIVYCRVRRYVDEQPSGEEQQIACFELGVAVDSENTFRHVRTVLAQKGHVTREQRERLTRR